MDDTYLKLEDAEIHYELHGASKNKILFINGMNTGIGGWLEQIKFFHDSKDYEICVYSNRGIGQSSPYYGRTTTTMFAKDAVELVNHLKWDKFHLIGVSMGGMVSQELALMIPEKIRSLSLCATYSSIINNRPGLNFFYNFLKGGTFEDKMMNNMFSGEFIENNYEKASFLIQSKIQKDYSLGFGFSKGFTAATQFLTAVTHNLNKDKLLELKNSKIPIWVCTGIEDTVVQPHNSLELINELSPVKTNFYPKVGHGLNIQHADVFNNDFLDFIKNY